MNIRFGVVMKFFPQKGFGFVTHPLNSGTLKDVFFHISNVQKSHKDIANKLSSYESGDDVYFWYESENTQKGEQLKRILKADSIHELLKHNINIFIKNIEYLWKNIGNSQPIWLNDVTRDLLGMNGLNKLSLERESLIKEKKEAEEQQRKERERLQKIEKEEIEEKIIIINEERKKQLEFQERQRKVEEEEFEQLVDEIQPKDFTQSSQVSQYIIRNRLGDKYKHISGVLEMMNSHSSWKFNGGFHLIYMPSCVID